MTTNQIIKQMEKELAKEFTILEYGMISVDHKENERLIRFVSDYTRTLLESFGEEVIPKESTHSYKIKDNIMYLEQGAADHMRWEQGYNTAIDRARLKMKEIINSIGK